MFYSSKYCRNTNKWYMVKNWKTIVTNIVESKVHTSTYPYNVNTFIECKVRRSRCYRCHYLSAPFTCPSTNFLIYTTLINKIAFGVTATPQRSHRKFSRLVNLNVKSSPTSCLMKNVPLRITCGSHSLKIQHPNPPTWTIQNPLQPLSPFHFLCSRNQRRRVFWTCKSQSSPFMKLSQPLF